MSEAPERIWANVAVWGDFKPLAGEWNHKDVGNPDDTEYVRADIHDISQTERQADGEYIGHLQARVEELEAALGNVDGELWDHGFAADGGMRSTIRAALTPPEQ